MDRPVDGPSVRLPEPYGDGKGGAAGRSGKIGGRLPGVGAEGACPGAGRRPPICFGHIGKGKQGAAKAAPRQSVGVSFSLRPSVFQIMYNSTSSASEDIAVPGTPPMS